MDGACSVITSLEGFFAQTYNVFDPLDRREVPVDFDVIPDPAGRGREFLLSVEIS